MGNEIGSAARSPEGVPCGISGVFCSPVAGGVVDGLETPGDAEEIMLGRKVADPDGVGITRMTPVGVTWGGGTDKLGVASLPTREIQAAVPSTIKRSEHGMSEFFFSISFFKHISPILY
jgi:hypothetical protein